MSVHHGRGGLIGARGHTDKHGGHPVAATQQRIDPREQWHLTPMWKRILLFCPKWQRLVTTWQDGAAYHYASDRKLARIHLEQTFSQRRSNQKGSSDEQ